MSNPAFSELRDPPRTITVTGIDSKAPIKVTKIGKHAILGEVLFGDFSTNLIGVPYLLRNGFELHCVGDTMNITRSSNQSIVYTAYRNKHSLYECDINVTPLVLEAFNASVN